jgi:hypothetical protein
MTQDLPPLSADDWTKQNGKAQPSGKPNFGLIILLFIVLSVGGALAYNQIKGGGEILVVEKCCDEILLGPKTALFVRADAPVRIKPSLEKGRVSYTYKRGTTVMGDVVTGEDGKSRWLKQKGDGWFIATKDLSTGAPPRLVGALPEASMTMASPLEVRQIPNDKAPVITTLAAGTLVQMVGTDKNGYTEIVFEHPSYRVGYAMIVGQ